MSYRCRDFIRTLNLSRFEMTVTPVAPKPTNASGPQPSLIDVFKRHPKWKKRAAYLLKHRDKRLVPGDKRRRREARSSGRPLKPVPQTEERPDGRLNKGARHA